MEQPQKPGQPTGEEKERLFARILSDASQSGYYLNPDKEYALFLMNGLLVNESRYGYQSCPCRLSTGIPERDLDLVCPCDYRDADLSEYGMCYCSLYVSKEIAEGKKQTASIPERRGGKAKSAPNPVQDPVQDPESASGSLMGRTSLPVWRCRACGYLCAREDPPEICPICKAQKERFERFM